MSRDSGSDWTRKAMQLVTFARMSAEIGALGTLGCHDEVNPQ